MTFLNKIIEWELEKILNEKQWEFYLLGGFSSFKEKVNSKVVLINKRKLIDTDFYGYMNDGELIIRSRSDLSLLNRIKPTSFYFYGKVYPQKNLLIGSFRSHKFYRLTSLLLLNLFFCQVLVYALCFIFSYISDSYLGINSSDFFVATFGTIFLIILIVIESKMLRFFSKKEEERIFKLLSDSAAPEKRR